MKWRLQIARMFKGNREKVNKDAEVIAERLRAGTALIRGLCREYSCAYPTMMRAVLTQMTKDEYRKLAVKRVAQSGIKTRLKKGCAAWNKGLHYQPGGRCPETQFRKGHLPHNHKHKGEISIRKCKNDTLFRFIKTKGIVDGQHRWIPFARYVWEQANGPVPEGMFPVHSDGDTLNDELSNIEIVDRAGHLANMRKNNPKVYKKIARTKIRNTKRRRRLQAGAQKLIDRQAKKSAAKIAAEIEEMVSAQQNMDELYGRPVEIVQCVGCGYQPENTDIERCPKCGSISFEEFQQRMSRPMATCEVDEFALV